jgi:hypothetical protein
MSLEDLYTEIHSLQSEIEEHERNFDAALQHTPSQVDLARSIYKNIKILEGRLTGLRILLDQQTGIP